jgi:hypothetical protein
MPLAAVHAVSEAYMLHGKRPLLWLALSFLLFNSLSALAQSEDGSPSLTEEQKTAMSKAMKDFADSHWAEAFDEFKALHEQLPDNAKVVEFLAEASLNTGKADYAQSLLAPLVNAEPDRWQALALLTRYYAESNNDSARDAGLAKLQEMHDSGKHPKLSAMDTILLERHAAADGGTVTIWYSLKPWGRFNAYLYARYCDKDGHETSYMTLESADFDQPLWAKQHPTEAAAGERMFSLDSYGVPVKHADGTVTATHGTMGFFNGRPPYDQIRDRMVSAANKAPAPISTLKMNVTQPAPPQ